MKAQTTANEPSTFSDEQLVEMYRQMVLIRRCEEMCQRGYDRDKVGGYMHLYIGQEALAVGIIACLRPDDYVATAYRDHAQAIVRGMPPQEMIAEVFGRSGGCSKGKGGSMHLFDAKRNFLGGYGIVGGHVPIATGAAFASKYRGTDQVTVCYIGDGAVNAGAFHEALNMAGLWKLPILYVIENNLYAMGTSVNRSTGEPELFKRAIPYGFSGKRIEAMDVMKVRMEAQAAIDAIRSGGGPMLIEAMTYRFVGHGAADKVALQTYRTQEEVNEWRTRDSIACLAAQILESGAMTQAELNALDDVIRQEAEQAYGWADASPEPERSEVATHVYTDMMPKGSD